jgi:hypothetical protein
LLQNRRFVSAIPLVSQADRAIASVSDSHKPNQPCQLISMDSLPPRLASLSLDTKQHPSFFLMPGLRAQPLWDLPALTEELHRHHAAILAEYEALRARGAASERVLQQVASGRWDMFTLMDEGQWNAEVCEACPATMAVLRALPLPVCESA